MSTKRSHSYQVGLRDGWQHCKHAAATFDVFPTAEDAANIGNPSDLDGAEYREGYADGIARFHTGKRSPNLRVKR